MGSNGIKWTNQSVLALAGDGNPVDAIIRAARALALKARETGWQGPPFNPVQIAELLGVRISANASIADARLIELSGTPVIEFNPQQPRERVRFSIAHELAHMLFPDWQAEVRNRSSAANDHDNWQLEMLCNVAASEIVLPVGSLPADFELAPIEALMHERRRYDVSAEAFLIRLARVNNAPVSVFFASPVSSVESQRRYRVDYAVASPTAPKRRVEGLLLPEDSVAHHCTAIGHTDRAIETWFDTSGTLIEVVGIPGYPGSRYPRVAGIVHHAARDLDRTPVKYVHGNVLEPLGSGPRIMCQLVNDKATRWGGGVARRFADKFPEAEKAYLQSFFEMGAQDRLGRVVYAKIGDDDTLASIIAQEGFGPSLFPRLRYSALQTGLRDIASHAVARRASVHMPRIGTGAAGGVWDVIQELIEDSLVRVGLSVTVYDVPPPRKQFDLFG